MRTVLHLLHLQIDNKTDILKAHSPKKMLGSALKALLFFLLLLAGFAIMLSRIFSLGIHINAHMLAIILAATQAISLCFAVGTIISTLYLSGDNEMLICLPVTPNQLFLSKILLIYIKELAVTASFFAPIFLCLGFFGNYGASFFLAIPIFLLILPILPIVLASFISIPVMAVIRFLKPRPTLSIIAILLLVAGVLAGYITLIGSFAETFNIANKQLETVREINAAVLNIGKYIVVYSQLALALVSFKSWFYIPLFVLLCTILAAVTILVIRPFYFKTAMTSRENTVRQKSRVRPFRKASSFGSLIARETRCIFRSPTDIFEYFLFTLLMPFIVFSYDKLLMSITVNDAGVHMIAGAHVMIVAIMAMLSNLVSASAISRDGSNFHTSKTIPVSYHTQIFAKLTFNAIFTVSALLLTMLVSVFIYPAWQIVLGTVAVAIAAIGHIAYSIDMDIRSPSINMQGDEQASNVSKSTPKSLIFGLALGFVMGLIIIMSASSGNTVAPYLLLILLSLIFTAYRIWMLILRIHLAYDKIEM